MPVELMPVDQEAKRAYHRNWKHNNYAINKEDIRKKQNAYRRNNPDKVRKWKKDEYERTKEIKLLKDKIYVLTNKEKVKKRRRKYYLKNKKLIIENLKRRTYHKLKSWEGYIPKETICQCCNKKIFLNSTDCDTSIHFDHKNEGKEVITHSPTIWLQRNWFNEENKKLWDTCNFGILCQRCNRSLPTCERKKFLINAVKYVFGIDLMSACPELSV